MPRRADDANRSCSSLSLSDGPIEPSVSRRAERARFHPTWSSPLLQSARSFKWCERFLDTRQSSALMFPPTLGLAWPGLAGTSCLDALSSQNYCTVRPKCAWDLSSSTISSTYSSPEVVQAKLRQSVTPRTPLACSSLAITKPSLFSHHICATHTLTFQDLGPAEPKRSRCTITLIFRFKIPSIRSPDG